MKKMDKGKKFMIISICILVLAIAGSAYAYYQKVLFADLDVDAAIKGLDYYINYTKGQNITGELLPTTEYTNGSSAEVTFYKKDNTYDIYGHIYLDVSSIGTNLSNSSALKYTLVSNDEVLAEGDLKGATSDSSTMIKCDIPLTTTLTKYRLYIWIDENDIDNYNIENESIAASIRCNATMKKIGPASKFIGNMFNPNDTTINNNITYEIDTTNQLIKDSLGNIRYYGYNPNNYIDIGDNELWRIIGVFKDVELSNGTKKDLIKLIRSSGIGNYSWDTSPSNVNYGYGINQWGPSGDYEGADLMRLLNPKPDGTSYSGINGSLYWNSQRGTCYSENNNSITSCDFTSTGLADKVKPKIAEVKWNLGGGSSSSIYPNATLTMERGEGVCGKNGIECYNYDTVTRQTTWIGKIALPYLSDYGYATDLSQCTKTLYDYDSSTKSYACRGNNWMWYTLTGSTTASRYGSNDAWLLTTSSYNGYSAWIVGSTGSVHYNVIVSYSYSHVVLPVLYLSSETIIESGIGTTSDPYVLSD